MGDQIDTVMLSKITAQSNVALESGPYYQNTAGTTFISMLIIWVLYKMLLKTNTKVNKYLNVKCMPFFIKTEEILSQTPKDKHKTYSSESRIFLATLEVNDKQKWRDICHPFQ